MGESIGHWPNLFVPGAGKSGTSALHDYLNQHPDIWMSVEKEPVFFNRLERYQSKKSRNYYLSLFAKGKSKRYRGESSTDYMCSEEAALRIKATVYDPKFIFILRNPIDRAFSHYLWLKGRGFEARPFKEAFAHSYQQFKRGLKDHHPSYYSEGLYSKWIENYVRIFGKENIHLILSESLKSNALNTLNGCFAFLGLRLLAHVKSLYENKSMMLTNPSLYKRMMILLSEEGDNIYKDFYRFVLPDRIRIPVRRQVVRVLDFFKDNIASRKPVPTFDDEVRLWVKRYYEEEVMKMREITNLNIYLWKDF